jgi:hypothetical protein
MSKPEMMQPRCKMCEQDFTPGPFAMLGIHCKVIDESGAFVKEIRFNLCDRCSQKVRTEIRRLKKIEAATFN